jgi:hypothetical protein
MDNPLAKICLPGRKYFFRLIYLVQLIPMNDQSLTIMIRNLAMDFGYKPQGDMDIVRGFMAKIGDKCQAFVNQ